MSTKIVIVLNKTLEAGVTINAASHMALGLVARAAKERPEVIEQMMFQDYKDKDGRAYPFISGLSLIVLRAKEGEIKKFDLQCRELGLLSTAFVSDMTGETYVEQLARLKEKSTEAVVYYGVCAIADAETLAPLTKRFSLWK